MTFLRRFRLRTLLLLIIILALIFGLFVQNRREIQLQSTLAMYRNPKTEAIYDALDKPLATTYPDLATLENVLKEVKARTMGKLKLMSGIPIYVDPVGLQEAGQSMTSRVERPLSRDDITLGEQLRHVLEPLGLGYEVKDGFLMISSKESLDTPTGVHMDPYLQYRDVLP